MSIELTQLVAATILPAAFDAMAATERDELTRLWNPSAGRSTNVSSQLGNRTKLFGPASARS
jgi:hypothetical protein